MRKVIHKIFWAWDYDKEEAWLNKMASEGLALVSVNFIRYEFEECAPSEYSFQIELLEEPARSEKSRQYISFVEETGAECVGQWIKWVYFRKKTNGEEFKLFSDKDSLISHLKRIVIFLAALCILLLPIGLMNVFIGFGRSTGNLVVGIADCLLGIFALRGTLKINSKKRTLEKERQISE